MLPTSQQKSLGLQSHRKSISITDLKNQFIASHLAVKLYQSPSVKLKLFKTKIMISTIQLILALRTRQSSRRHQIVAMNTKLEGFLQLRTIVLCLRMLSTTLVCLTENKSNRKTRPIRASCLAQTRLQTCYLNDSMDIKA